MSGTESNKNTNRENEKQTLLRGSYVRKISAEKNNHYPTFSGVVPNIVSDIAKPAVELQYIKDFIKQRQSKNCMTQYSLSIENLNSPRH